MLEQAKVIEIQKTDSVIEALFLESNLIKKYKPKYNTRFMNNIEFSIELPKLDFKLYEQKNKNDENPTLTKRAELANDKNADFFISLHSDDFVPCPVSGGTHVLYYDVSNSFFLIYFLMISALPQIFNNESSLTIRAKSGSSSVQ